MTSNDTWELVRLLADVERKQSGDARDAAIAESVKACRALEAALQEALGREPLRGLPNIGPGNRPRALRRIRTNALRQLSTREELCVNVKGELVMADGFRERRVCDDELTAADATCLVHTLTVAMDAHLTQTAATSATYDEMRDLATRIVSLVKR